MTKIKVSSQDIKPLHHIPPGHLFWTPSGHTSLYITIEPLLDTTDTPLGHYN